MPRIAVIADIHGNHFALEAVIDHLEQRDVDEIIVAGDLVGRGPQGNDVVHRIAGLGWPCLRGNHEDYLLSFCRGDVPDSWLYDEEWAASRWMADELDEQALAFIDDLPFSLRSRVDPGLQVFHGSPNSHSEGIGAWTPQSRMDEYLEAIDGDLLACAHTHRPLKYRGQSGLIVNVGSVGLPFNGDWRAQYAIFQGDGKTWHVHFEQVPYHREAFLEYYDTSGFLDAGGITARLLHYEVRYARPFLVPFLKWADKTEHPPHLDYLDEFLDAYDPGLSMAQFLAGLD